MRSTRAPRRAAFGVCTARHVLSRAAWSSAIRFQNTPQNCEMYFYWTGPVTSPRQPARAAPARAMRAPRRHPIATAAARPCWESGDGAHLRGVVAQINTSRAANRGCPCSVVGRIATKRAGEDGILTDEPVPGGVSTVPWRAGRPAARALTSVIRRRNLSSTSGCALVVRGRARRLTACCARTPCCAPAIRAAARAHVTAGACAMAAGSDHGGGLGQHTARPEVARWRHGHRSCGARINRRYDRRDGAAPVRPATHRVYAHA